MSRLESMTPQERAEVIAERARDLVAQAEMLGVSLRIDRVPIQPPRSGHMRHVVEAWPARHGPKAPN